MPLIDIPYYLIVDTTYKTPILPYTHISSTCLKTMELLCKSLERLEFQKSQCQNVWILISFLIYAKSNSGARVCRENKTRGPNPQCNEILYNTFCQIIVLITIVRDDYILIKVEAVALNPTDWKHVTFAPVGAKIGCDYAGTVEVRKHTSIQTTPCRILLGNSLACQHHLG